MRRAVLALASAVALASLICVAAFVGGREAEAALPGKDGRIFFSSNRVTPANPTGDFEIFSMNPDGSGVRQITVNRADDSSPAVSPDGKMVAYSGSDGSDDPDFEIWTIPSVGGKPTRLTNTSGIVYEEDPAFSPDGKRIAYEEFECCEGSSIDTVIRTIPVSGGGSTQLTPYDESSDFSPVYAPDGKKIVFARDEGSGSRIFSMNPDGSGAAPLSGYNDVLDSPDVSPDGKRIVFEGRELSGTSEIFVKPLAEATTTQLTANEDYDGGPAFSPDGRTVAYTSIHSATNDAEIFAVPASGGTPANLTNNPNADDKDPYWQRNAAPEVRPFLPRRETTDRRPLIKALVRDAETDLAKNNIRFFLDGREEPFGYDPSTDALTRTPARLSYGGHAVRVVARDGAGQTTSQAWRFTVVRP